MNWLVKILHRVSIATMLLVIMPPIAMAQSPTPATPTDMAAYKVTDVAVDATADNAVQARDRAIANGQVQALQTLLRRLTASNPPASLPTPSAESVQNMVLAISVSAEKRSSVRYIAKLSIQFVPAAIQRLLDESKTTYSTQVKSVTILPVYRATANAEPVLWEEPNPWRAVWPSHSRNGLLKLEVPAGDWDDVRAGDTGRVESADATLLKDFSQRYGSGEAVVLIANQSDSGVSVVAKRSDGTTVQATVRALAGETTPALLGRAADTIATAMQGEWKAAVAPQVAVSPAPVSSNSATTPSGTAETLPPVAAQTMAAPTLATPTLATQTLATQTPAEAILPTQDLVMVAPVPDLAGWLSMRARLGLVPVVKAVELQAIASNRVQVLVRFSGNERDFNDLLTPQGLTVESTGTVWVLKNIRSASAIPTGAMP